MERKKRIIILGIIITISIVILLFVGFFISSMTSANNINGDSHKIKLTKANEKYNFDKLQLVFTGVAENEKKGYYNYVLDVTYDDKIIGSSIFNNKDNYRIWSSNKAAHFNVYQIGDVYILDSFRAGQCDSDSILIFNTNGDVLKAFDSVTLSINNDVINITDTILCGNNKDDNIIKYRYKVVDSNIIMDEK